MLNPALPVLALLSLAGLLIRRPAGRVWFILGLAGMALFWPALRLPTGIVSPAAELTNYAPWQIEDGPLLGNAIMGDITSQHQPWLTYLQREFQQGRLPFWNPHQYSGYPFWANGQTAPFYPLHLLFIMLPTQLGFILLPWLRFLIAGLGTWALARQLGLSNRAALVSALIFPLSGMFVSYIEFPMGNALSLIPWILLAVDRLIDGRGRWWHLALVIGLQLLSGHPETGFHMGMLVGIYMLFRRAHWRIWARLVTAALVAGAIAAIHLLPTYHLVLASSKWAFFGGQSRAAFELALFSPLRLILPDLYGNPALGTWWGPFNYLATSVYASVAAIPLALAGARRARLDLRWLAIGVIFIFSFLIAFHFPGLHDILIALPILDRIAHHRLMFGIDLSLALLAGAGVERWLSERRLSLFPGVLIVVLALAVAWLRYLPDWTRLGQTPAQLGWIAAAIIICLLLLLSTRRLHWRQRAWPLLAGVIVIDLLSAHSRNNPGLPFELFYPETGAVQFLQQQAGRFNATDNNFLANAALVYGLYDIRGHDSVNFARYIEFFSRLSDAPRENYYFMMPVTKWDQNWLDQLGVRWVATAPGAPSPDPAWPLAYDGTDARVYERPSALPLVRLEGQGQVEVLRQVPGLWEVRYDTGTDTRLIVAETWADGWQAWVEGEPHRVERTNEILMSVPLPAGRGTVVLAYTPPGFIAGLMLSIAGLGVVLAAVIVQYRRTRPPSPSATRLDFPGQEPIIRP